MLLGATSSDVESVTDRRVADVKRLAFDRSHLCQETPWESVGRCWGLRSRRIPSSREEVGGGTKDDLRPEKR